VAGCFHEELALDGAPVLKPRRIRVQALGWPGPWREVEARAEVLIKRAIGADGAVRHLLSSDGEPSDERRDLYDLALVVFGLAEAAHALGGAR
jgi:mannose-6-phosphate isomerase